MLADIWSEVLGVEKVGIHNNFFDLGGHSLLATQVISRVHRNFAVQLPVSSIFESPTVAMLSEVIVKVRKDCAETEPREIVAFSRERYRIRKIGH